MCHKYHVKRTSEQCNLDRLKSQWIGKGYQRDANLCGACARPADERSESLVRGGGGSRYNQGFCVLC